MTGKAAPVHPRLTPRKTPDADLIQIFIAKNGVTKPTTKQEKRAAKKELRARGMLTASNLNAYRSRPGNEAFGHRSNMMSEGFTLDYKPLPLEKLTGEYAEEPAPKAVPVPAQPLPPVMGHCAHCQKPLPRRTRSDAKYCNEAHKKADQRRKKKWEEAERALFKTKIQIAGNTYDAAMLSYDYYHTARVMSDEDVTFLGTPYGILVVEDVPGAARAALSRNDWFGRGRSLFLRPILPETEHCSTDRDVIAAVEAARTRTFGWSYIEKERQIEYLRGLDDVLKGPERKVLLFMFGARSWSGRPEMGFWPDVPANLEKA